MFFDNLSLFIVFFKYFDLLQTLIINIIVGLAGALPIAIITILFKNKFTKWIGIVIALGSNFICLYVALVKAAILGQLRNEWGVAYIVGVLQDIFMS